MLLFASRFLRTVFFTLLFFSLFPLVAQNTSPGNILRMQLDDIVAPYLAASDFQGVVGIQRDGEEPLILPYGFASVELGVPHRAANVFMIGSVSKQFTAVAILLLEEAGALKTSDVLSTFLPDFPRGDAITIEQLLTHTSGVADVYSLKRFGETAGLSGTFEQVLADLAKQGLTFEPDSGYAYSNGGYSLLAAIIEKASGMSYQAYLEEMIFRPLGMKRTASDARGRVVRNRVPGYDPFGSTELMPVKAISPAYTLGNGSIWSSAADLLKWTYALHNGMVLNETSYKKLTRDYGRSYGYGVSVYRRFDTPVVSHDGRVAGYASDLARYTEKKLSVVILSNVQSVARDNIRQMVAAAVLGKSYAIQKQRDFVESDPSQLKTLTGVYSFGPFFNVFISTSGGRLLAQANEGGISELVAMSEEKWFSRMLYAAVRFGRDENGTVDRLIWGLSESAPVGKKRK